MTSNPIFKTKWRVWWRETDAAGIMHFSRFFTVCERVEEEFYFHIGLGEKVRMAGHKIWFPRVHAECDYVKPLFPRSTYEVSISRIELGETSIKYFYEFRDESGDLSARCMIATVAVTGLPPVKVPIPDELRKELLARGAVERKKSQN